MPVGATGHQLVFRNGMNPRRQGLRGIVGVALIVHGQQCFLQEILHFVWPMAETLSKEGPQVSGQFLQERMVGRRLAGETLKKQISQACLARAYVALLPNSLPRCIWLQPDESNFLWAPIENELCWGCNRSLPAHELIKQSRMNSTADTLKHQFPFRSSPPQGVSHVQDDCSFPFHQPASHRKQRTRARRDEAKTR